jgi:hypothetical protein
LENVTIFLTIEEVKQFQSYLNHLLDNPKLQHPHLSSDGYQEEITICLYDEKDLEGFHPRAKKLIDDS